MNSGKDIIDDNYKWKRNYKTKKLFKICKKCSIEA